MTTPSTQHCSVTQHLPVSVTTPSTQHCSVTQHLPMSVTTPSTTALLFIWPSAQPCRMTANPILTFVAWCWINSTNKSHNLWRCVQHFNQTSKQPRVADRWYVLCMHRLCYVLLVHKTHNNHRPFKSQICLPKQQDSSGSVMGNACIMLASTSKYKKDSQRLDRSGRILPELVNDCLYGLTKVTVHRKLKKQAQLNLIVKLNFTWNL